MLRKLCLFSIELTFIVCLMILEASAVQSRWGSTFNKTTDKQYSIFPNYLYQGASVTVTIMCYSKDEDVHVKVDWLLQEVDCMEQIYKVDMESDLAVFGILETVSGVNGTTKSNNSENVLPDNNLKKRKVTFQRSKGSSYPCQMNNVVTLQDESEDPYYIGSFPIDMNIRDIPFEEIEIKKKEKRGTASKKNKMIFHEVTRAWEDGMYHMLLSVIATDPKKDFEATAVVEMHGRYGFLSAIDWPLLPYNSVMAFLYLILATVWIIIWARSHKHTLKIHVVMGFIAVAGAMCHTLQFIEHAAVNSNGGGVKGLLWFARVLVSAQISVLYLILMIVSTGYGITRPKLSKTYIIPITALAGLNFILDSMWKISVDESLKIQYEYPFFTKCLLWMKTAMLLIITGWILIAAISTFVHLCHRRHSSTRLVVFSMYTATIAVVFVSNLVMFGISMGWMHACRKNWQLEWIFSSFSSMGSFVLLIVLMWLWRPVDTAQSYAFAPLGDGDDDEMDEFLADDDEEDSDVEEFNMEKTKIRLEPL